MVRLVLNQPGRAAQKKKRRRRKMITREKEGEKSSWWIGRIFADPRAEGTPRERGMIWGSEKTPVVVLVGLRRSR